MVRSCACRSSTSWLTVAGGAVPPLLPGASRCLADSGCCLAHSGGEVWNGGVSCSAWRRRASATCTTRAGRAEALFERRRCFWEEQERARACRMLKKGQLAANCETRKLPVLERECEGVELHSPDASILPHGSGKQKPECAGCRAMSKKP